MANMTRLPLRQRARRFGRALEVKRLLPSSKKPRKGLFSTLKSVGKAGPNNAVMGLEDGGSYRVAGRGIDGLDGAEP